MKKIVFLFLLLVVSLRGAEPASVGEWSEPVKGLRGRLVLAEDTPYHGTRIAVVYLELQNMANVLNPLLVDFKSPRLQLVDAAGKTVEQAHPAEDIFSVAVGALVLPFDSTLRFRISVTGYGLPADGHGSLAVQLPDACWIIPPGEPGEHFLTGTFSIPELKMDEHHADAYLEAVRKDLARGNHVWRGTLHLPKVKIPAAAGK